MPRFLILTDMEIQGEDKGISLSYPFSYLSKCANYGFDSSKHEQSGKRYKYAIIPVPIRKTARLSRLVPRLQAT